MNRSRTTRFIFTIVIAVVGGYIFRLLHIPVPWLLGPMVFIMITNNISKYALAWHSQLRNVGLFLIGYTFGTTMTQETIHVVIAQLPYMFLMTTVLVLLCFMTAYFLSKITKIEYSSAMLSSIPGGLSQILVLAEEMKGVNITIVTVTQVIRVMMIVSLMPFLVLLPIFQDSHETSQTVMTTNSVSFVSFEGLVFFIVSLVVALIFKKINFPTAFLLGPMFGTAILQLVWTTGPTLPFALSDLAQLLIGVHVGRMLNFHTLPNKSKILFFAFANGAILIFLAFLLSVSLTYLEPLSHATSLLSLAPGGADQMGVIAHAINADLSVVSSYQVFRLFFIFFLIPPFIQFIFRKQDKK